jgi:hypothetical protein
MMSVENYLTLPPQLPVEKWEYQFVKPDRDPRGQLNYLGEQGWELVCIDYGNLILKRRKA